MSLRFLVSSQPSMTLLGIRVDEPVNTITHLLISAVCLFAYLQLRRRKPAGRTQLYFRWYFLLLALGTMFGGLIGHGFLYAFTFAWKLPGWIVSMLSVAFIERSSIEYARPYINPRLGKFFLILNLIELATIMTITIYTLDFGWVEIHSGYGLLAVVVPFHGYTYYKTRNRGSFLILIAVAIASMAALIFMNQISLHTWFNHIDISHIDGYRGICLLSRRAGVETTY